MRIKEIQEEIMERFPEDIKMEKGQLYIGYRSIHIKNNWFSGVSVKTNRFTVKGRNFKTIKDSVYNVILSELVEIKTLQAIREFDEDAFLIKISDTLTTPDFLYVFHKMMNFKIFCRTLENGGFQLVMSFFNGANEIFNICDDYETVLQEGITHITKKMKMLRLYAVTQNHDDVDIENMFSPFSEGAMEFLRLQLLVLEKENHKKAEEIFVKYFKEKYDPYLPYINPIDEKEDVEKIISLVI